MSSSLTNTDRSYAAFLAIKRHCYIKHACDCSPQDLDDALTDLLADLMHFANDEQHFDQCLSTARLHFYAEQGEQS